MAKMLRMDPAWGVDPGDGAPIAQEGAAAKTVGQVEDRLTALYRQYGPVIYARCRRMLGQEASAEDATQETFMRVYRHLDKAPDSSQALAWIYRIATNYCLNEIRNRKLRPDSREVLPERAERALEGRLVDRDFTLRLLRRVPDKLAAPAWLHYVDGLEQGEVARVLGISRRTVSNRLADFARAAAKLERT